MTAQTGAAGRRADRCLCINKYLYKAFFDGLFIYFLRGGYNDQTDMARGFLLLENARCNPEVFYPAVCARPDNNLINLDIAHLADAPDV